MKYIVMDLEFNQSFDFYDGTKTILDTNCPFEIIQIGAVILDDNFEFLDKCSLLIKPQIYKKIHPFVEKITGLSDKLLSEEEYFPEAYSRFVKFLGNGKNVFCVWGTNDIKELYKNIIYYNLNHKVLPRKYIDVQKFAGIHLNHPNGMAIGLKNAVINLNLNEDISFHDALNDAIYTSEVFKIVKKDTITPQVFNLNILKKNIRETTHKVDTPLLYKFVEKEFGRKLSRKEKDIMKNVYKMGVLRRFDINK